MLFGKRRQKEDVRRTEILADLSRVILQCIHDEGGNEGTVYRIIEDAKGGRRLLTPFVRHAIGPIWELAEDDVKLDPINLATPIDPKNTDVKVTMAVLNACWEPPEDVMFFGNETYSLWHSCKSYSPGDVGHLSFNNGRELATLRELYWYVRRFGTSWLGRHRILAGGTREYQNKVEDWMHGWPDSFPVAYVEGQGIVIDKTPVVSDISERCFGPEHFYLVRNTRPDLKSYSRVFFGSCP